MQQLSADSRVYVLEVERAICIAVLRFDIVINCVNVTKRKRVSLHIWSECISLADPSAIDIVDRSSNKRSIVTQEKGDDVRNLHRLSSSFLDSHLQATCDALLVFALRHRSVD